MNVTYKTQITIHADVDSAWGVIARQNFSQDYFPEIKKNFSGMSDYVFSTHKNTDRVMPSYTAPNPAIEWAMGVIGRQNFSQDYFPEIKTDLSGMSDYVLRTHKNIDRVLPSYTIPKKAIGWVTGGSNDIRLTRKDVHANIEAIDIELIEKGEYTTIKIEVAYAPKLDKNFFLAHRCVRGLIKTKLAVLKQELEENNSEITFFAAVKNY